MDLWLRTDETIEAISALEMLAETAPSLTEDNYRWKWVIIIIHNALQGFMVLSLRHGNGLLALKDKIAEQCLKAYREGDQYPLEKLDNFLNLYKKIKNDRIRMANGRIFKATPAHDRAVKKLNELRNEFIHFVPKGWSLGLTNLPEICLRCLEIIEFLSLESRNITFDEEIQQKRIISALKKAKNVLTGIKETYEEAAIKTNATNS